MTPPDQTPTPTRFLKNCEEVGLFNELASSFEHEFKKAAEDEEKKARGEGQRWEPGMGAVPEGAHGTSCCVRGGVFLWGDSGWQLGDGSPT